MQNAPGWAEEEDNHSRLGTKENVSEENTQERMKEKKKKEQTLLQLCVNMCHHADQLDENAEGQANTMISHFKNCGSDAKKSLN